MRNIDLRIARKGGDAIDCQVSAETVSINGQECVLLAWLDITDRKRSELELVDAIETVMQDSTWFSKSLVEKLANVRRDGGAPSNAVFDDLTKREREVLEALCHGYSDKEIAKRLTVALGTVRNHVARIYAKLDVHNRNAALLWARRHGCFTSMERNAKGGSGREA